MRKNLYATGLIFILVLFLSASCATLFGPQTHPLDLTTQPAGADVYVNGVNLGATPLQLNLKADQSYNIEFRKDGYKTITRTVNSRVGGGWIVLDILGGLIPIIVDAATGNWNVLDQKNIDATLSAEEQ
ncbi:MAG: PEGA domain-containing protein [Bacteroidota bacterium]